MKQTGLLIIYLFWNSSSLSGQDIPGFSYCMLFESALEKQAFLPGTKQDALLQLMSYDAQMDLAGYASVRSELADFIERLQQKKEKFRQPVRYLAYVFGKIHRRYLKHYSNQEYFNSLFDKGTYNCITGSALYAYLLSQLGYKIAIYETRLHVFTLVYLQDTIPVLIESTDPLEGCTVEQEEINEKIQQYLKNDRQALEQTNSMIPPFNKKAIMREVTPSELAGLHYYNMAIDKTNQHDYMQALIYVSKAQLLYPDGERIEHLKQFLAAKYNTELDLH